MISNGNLFIINISDEAKEYKWSSWYLTDPV